jgi:hypothetical protein
VLTVAVKDSFSSKARGVNNQLKIAAKNRISVPQTTHDLFLALKISENSTKASFSFMATIKASKIRTAEQHVF